MEDLFKHLFGDESTPVRRTLTLRIRHDSDGRSVVEPVEGKAITLSDEGSIDTISFTPDRFYDCGCNADAKVGGQCAETACKRVSCTNCFTRCLRCAKALCLMHARIMEDRMHGRQHLCVYCHNTVTRRCRLLTGLRVAASPFLVIEKRQDK